MSSTSNSFLNHRNLSSIVLHLLVQISIKLADFINHVPLSRSHYAGFLQPTAFSIVLGFATNLLKWKNEVEELMEVK